MGKTDGFTLIEVLMVIAMISILAVGSMTLMGSDINEARYQTTLKRMFEIRRAMIGEENGGASGTRFGYLGDIGGLPRTGDGIQALLEPPPGTVSFNVDPLFKMGTGWNGPYLPDPTFSRVDYTKDEWGNPFIYNADAEPATLKSLGADGVEGGAGYGSDITLMIPTELRRATLHGLIQNKGKPWLGTADVEISYPDGEAGKIIQQIYKVTPANPGAFSFYKIPVGEHAIRIFLLDQPPPNSILGPFPVRVDRPQSAIVLGAAGSPLNL